MIPREANTRVFGCVVPTLTAEQSSILKEPKPQQHIEHIKNIVTMQQSYAKVAGITEIVNVVDLVEYACA